MAPHNSGQNPESARHLVPLWVASLDIEPHAKGRPRITRGGRAYTPPRTAQWEREAAHLANLQWQGEPLREPCSVEVDYWFRRPQRLRWKTKPMPAQLWPCRGDVDNLCKALLDALQLGGVLYDDRIVVSLSARKLLCGGDDSSRVVVSLSWGQSLYDV